MKILLPLGILLLPFMISNAQLAPIPLGSASNVYTIVLDEQNQVAASDSLNAVVFIHRQDISVWGGTTADNGKLRYDLSTDGGSTFTNDVGLLNPVYTLPARYPSCAFYNPDNGTDISKAFVVWGGPSLDATPQWDGHALGVASVTTGTPVTKEHYNYIGKSAYIPGGLCQGLPGEFWMVDREFINPSVTFGDSLFIYKGTWDTASQDVNWLRFQSVMPPHNKPTGFTYFESPNISFSPDGMTGWIAWIGDVTGGQDSIQSPVFMKSTNGGQTWGTAFDVDMSVVPWIDDSLIKLNGGSGIPSLGLDFDLVVDSSGNPHLFATIFNGPAPGGLYSYFSNQGKFMGDVTSTDGGVTWTVRYVAPSLTFSFTYGVGANIATQYNRPQVSRTEDGSLIFYSWADTDTNGGLWGATQNTAPDLLTAGMRISDGYQTCFRNITKNDSNWHGNIIFPTASLTVLSTNSGQYKIPVVSTVMPLLDPFVPVLFYYWGNEVVWTNSDFHDPALLNLGWNGPCPGCPAPGIAFNSTVNGQVATFTDGSNATPVSWYWSFGDGGSDTSQNPVYSYSSAGTFTVCLTAANSCGSATKCDSVVITCVTPSGNFSFYTSGPTATFADSSGGSPTSWSWDFGDGNSSNQQNPSHNYATPGTYIVCLTATNSCGADTFCDSIVTCAFPVSGFSFSINGNQVTFTNSSANGSAWAWTFGDGNTSNQQNPIHNYTFQSTFNVCLVAVNACGTDTICQTVQVCDISAGFSALVTGAVAVFTDNSGGSPTGYSWTFGDGNSSTQPSPIHTYVASGNYTVCQSVNNICGTDSACQQISVTVGLADFGKGDFAVYPNPVNEFIQFQAEHITPGTLEITILNAVGQEVFPPIRLDHPGKVSGRLNTSKLSPGFNFLLFRQGSMWVTYPILKE